MKIFFAFVCVVSLLRLGTANRALDCPDIDKPDTLSTEIFLPVTEVPAVKDYFVCATVELPQDDDYYLIGVKPIIDNGNVMRHSILFGCEGSLGTEFRTPRECSKKLLGPDCDKFISGWTLGSPGHCFNEKIAVHFGKNSNLKRITIQHHWVNPYLHKGWKDGSGMKLFYTRTPREFQADSWLVAQESITIPPMQPQTVVEGTCSSECTQRHKGSIFIADALLHAHHLATAFKVVQKRNGIVIRTIVDENPYSSDNAIIHSFKNPVEIKPGDEVKITCTYNSLTKNTTTVWGRTPDAETCYAIFFVYPKNIAAEFCSSLGETSICHPTAPAVVVKQDCPIGVFYDPRIVHLMQATVAACKFGCNDLCAIFITGFKDTEMGCMSDLNLLILQYISLIEGEESVRTSFLKTYKKHIMCVLH